MIEETTKEILFYFYFFNENLSFNVDTVETGARNYLQYIICPIIIHFAPRSMSVCPNSLRSPVGYSAAAFFLPPPPPPRSWPTPSPCIPSVLVCSGGLEARWLVLTFGPLSIDETRCPEILTSLAQTLGPYGAEGRHCCFCRDQLRVDWTSFHGSLQRLPKSNADFKKRWCTPTADVLIATSSYMLHWTTGTCWPFSAVAQNRLRFFLKCSLNYSCLCMLKDIHMQMKKNK